MSPRVELCQSGTKVGQVNPDSYCWKRIRMLRHQQFLSLLRIPND